MKITVDYTILGASQFRKPMSGGGVTLTANSETHPDYPAAFPEYHLEFSVEDGSETARTICKALRLTPPTEEGL